MTSCRSLLMTAVIVGVTIVGDGSLLSAQVGKGSILDLNSATEKDLLALPHMTPAIAKGVIAKRPFGSIVELNAFLPARSSRRRSDASSTARRSST